MSFCGQNGIITSDAQLTTAFPNSILPSANADRFREGEKRGRLTANALETKYNELVASGALVSNTRYKQELSRVADTRNVNQQTVTTILSNLGTTESTTFQKIQQEFCFNYFRYKYSLETLFETLVNTSKKSSLTSTDRATIQSQLTRAKEFNEKLNDLIQIVNFIAQKRSTEMRDQNTEINEMNTNLQSTFDTLQSHNQLLNSETSVADLRKRMVEFTEEKNRSALNLLSLYGFLNLVAIGLLFYIARS
jgi:hypothetical protein